MKKKHYLFILLTASLSLLTLGQYLQSSNDSALDSVYKSSAGSMAPQAEPLVLLRRLSLQLRGVPPSLGEIKQFEESNTGTRMRDYTLRFIRDPGFAQYWATRFGSTLRDKSKGRGIKLGSFFKYLSTSLHKNKPWNQMVSEMLLATGDSNTNPATNFYLRDNADPLQIAEYVGRSFYGARLACARCHDHPFNSKFTRRDYYGFAAFFSQVYVERRMDNEGVPRDRWVDFPTKDRKKFEEKRNDWRRSVWNKMNDNQRKAYRKKHKIEFAKVSYNPALSLRFPHTDNAPGGDLVKLKYPDGTKALLDDGDDRREALVEWLTGEDNDRFRKVLINRIWTSLMGWSFFYPLDDWNDTTEMHHPEILEHLDQVFLKQNYKIKDLIHYIVSSKAWMRRSPTPNDVVTGNKTKFFPPRRLDPSQLLNTLIQGSGNGQVSHIWERAARVDPLGKINLVGRGRLLSVKERAKDLKNACEVARPARGNTFLGIFGEGARMDVDDNNLAPTIDQVLTLYNGRVTAEVIGQFRKKDNWLMKDYNKHKNIVKSLDKLYLGLLGRHMLENEKELLTRLTKSKYGRREQKFNQKIVMSLAWSIINSQEFIHLY